MSLRQAMDWGIEDRSFRKAEVGELVELRCVRQMVGAVSVKRGVDVTSEVEHDGFDADFWCDGNVIGMCQPLTSRGGL